MIQEIFRPWRHPLAVAASLLVVAALTVIGLWTNSTSERQTKVEHTVEVQRTQITQALCDKPFTKDCVKHAINVIRACVAVPRCAALLGSVPTALEATGGSRGQFPSASETSSANPAPKHETTHHPHAPPAHHPPHHGHGHEGGGHSGEPAPPVGPPPVPEPPAPAPTPAPVPTPGNAPPGKGGEVCLRNPLLPACAHIGGAGVEIGLEDE